MATLGPNGFNAHAHAPMTRYEPVPAGRYLAAVVESEIRATRAGDGQYVELRFQILDGEYRGRSVYTRLNLWNPNETAVAMARAELSSICRAIGARHLADTQQLHDIPIFIDVELRCRRDNGQVANEIRGYTARSEVFSADGTAVATSADGSSCSDCSGNANERAPWAAS